MTKLLLLALSFGLLTTASAQTDSTAAKKPVTTLPVTASPAKPLTTSKKDWSKVSLSNRSNDHFMLQLGYTAWSKVPDSLKTKGIPRTVNAYFMFDFPFKTDPRFSIGIGVGISTSGMYFNKNTIDIAGTTPKLIYKNAANTDHFKKYKLATSYLEVPVELRYTLNPEENNKSIKFALGAKVGTLVNAHIKGKNLQNSAGSLLNAYTLKQTSKRYFNGTRLSGTARIGIGVFSLFGTYQINTLLKTAVGPDIHPYTIGLTLSGL